MAAIRRVLEDARAGRLAAAGTGARANRPGQERGDLVPEDVAANAADRAARLRSRAGLSALPGAAARDERARLRRSAMLQTYRLSLRDFPEVLERWQRRARTSAGGRIPGHQSRAVSAGARRWSRERQSVRRRRRGPVDLPLAGRRYPQHPGFRARLSGGAGLQAGAELPLDQDHPGGGRRRDPATIASARPSGCGPTTSGRAGDLLHRQHRARRGRLYRARDRGI
jgi:hypothetical protein